MSVFKIPVWAIPTVILGNRVKRLWALNQIIFQHLVRPHLTGKRETREMNTSDMLLQPHFKLHAPPWKHFTPPFHLGMLVSHKHSGNSKNWLQDDGNNCNTGQIMSMVHRYAMLVQLTVTQKAKRIVVKKSNVIDFMGFVLGGFFFLDWYWYWISWIDREVVLVKLRNS